MSQLSGMSRRGGNANQARRRLVLEDEIIKIPDCDLTAAAERFKQTLIGRMFHREGRSIDALISLLPKPKIWDIEGRVHGINLGNGRFQFDFDDEEDMLKILAKRPWQFNRWMFSLEKWEPSTCNVFPNTMIFWVSVTGVPVHFWNIPTFTEIAKVLGRIINIDAKRAKFQISLDADAPLQIERKVGFSNGDTGTVSLTYEGLQRFCFTCKLLSHEEGTCPELTEEQREAKKKQRAEQVRDEVLPAYPNNHNLNQNRLVVQAQQLEERHSTRNLYDDQSRTSVPRREYHKSDVQPRYTEAKNQNWNRNDGKRDLRLELSEKQAARGREVWNRLERSTTDGNRYTRDRQRIERFHPYQQTREGAKGSREIQRDSHLVWRQKNGREVVSSQKYSGGSWGKQTCFTTIPYSDMATKTSGGKAPAKGGHTKF